MTLTSVLDIPEVRALDAATNMIRIPDQIDVPVTKRILKLIDTEAFQRLKRISQLGLVSSVYPAANHSRFEHSLGVYRMSLMVLRHLGYDPEFASLVNKEDGTALVLASLLHDIGHWPYCHPIEDIELEGVPEHEAFASRHILQGEIGEIIESEFGIAPQMVVDLVERNKETQTKSILCSILSGPIDVDKLDYLYRDSLHAGVPYGKNFDTARLVASFCLNQNKDRLAITHKGKTAAELMVFARYVMFSEVYWHHAARSGTAMLQRVIFELYRSSGPERLTELFHLDEVDFVREVSSRLSGNPIAEIWEGLFGKQRRLYKRLLSFGCFDNEPLYKAMAQRPYQSNVVLGAKVAESLGLATGLKLNPNDVLIDAPPVGLEVQFDVEVSYPKNATFRTLGEISPVVSTLARQQFDDFVKQVRIFIKPEFAEQCRSVDITSILESHVQVGLS